MAKHSLLLEKNNNILLEFINICSCMIAYTWCTKKKMCYNMFIRCSSIISNMLHDLRLLALSTVHFVFSNKFVYAMTKLL